MGWTIRFNSWRLLACLVYKCIKEWIILQYVTEILECGEFTRDYGVQQETVEIEKGSSMDQVKQSL